MTKEELPRACFAEAIGTFALVFVGCGAVAADSLTGGLGTVGIAMAFGLVVMAMIYAVGNVSGAHFNPAVTVGFWLAGRFELRCVPFYVLSQTLAAIAAAVVLWLLFPAEAELGVTRPAYGHWQAFGMEVVITFLLMFVILNVSTGAKEKGIMAGAAIGGTVALAALFAGPFSGASMNPARSLAPALISGDLTALWVYLTAPFLGAAIAFGFCRATQTENCCGPD